MFYFFLFETDLRPLISKVFLGGGWHDGNSSKGLNVIHQTDMGQKSQMCETNFNKTPGGGRHKQTPASTPTPLIFIRYLLNPDSVGKRYFKDLKDFYLHDLL